METEDQRDSTGLKLYLLLLGSKAPGRNVEQHDYFFAIGKSLQELIPRIKAFWPEAGRSIHIDGWREITSVDGHRVRVVLKSEANEVPAKKLFFINLGGYQPGKLEEQHYTVLTVQDDRLAAIQSAKKTVFFRTHSVAGEKGANSHIDEKYGVDVDDIYMIEEILTPEQKDQFTLEITLAENLPEDLVHLGYLTMDKLAKSTI
ncbi:DUF1543 domain-containing protein [Flavihumibacter sp. R14]|nr:DUF1543 domain-containing protein [Flavihumibacter soli]